MWQALFWLSFQLESGILEIQMNTSISGGMEGKDVCIEVFCFLGFFFNVIFFLFNVQTNKYFFMKKMCRLHFTFCIFCVCVRILVFVTPKWKIYSMGWVVLGLRWENDMIFVWISGSSPVCIFEL